MRLQFETDLEARNETLRISDDEKRSLSETANRLQLEVESLRSARQRDDGESRSLKLKISQLESVHKTELDIVQQKYDRLNHFKKRTVSIVAFSVLVLLLGMLVNLISSGSSNQFAT